MKKIGINRWMNFPWEVICILFTLQFCVLSCKDDDDEGKDGDKQENVSDNIRTFSVNGVSFRLIRVEGGSFVMGSQRTNPDAPGYYADPFDSEMPTHKVKLSSYYIGETEVTQALWYAVTNNHSYDMWWKTYGMGDQIPVNWCTWDGIKEIFLPALNDSLHNSGQLSPNETIDLPTEAQWEFAAKGGNKSKSFLYSGSNDANEVGWIAPIEDNNDMNKKYVCHEVAQKKMNEIGLYDMTGNASEWVRDKFAYYTGADLIDPISGDSTKGVYRDMRVIKGGSIELQYYGCRNAYRTGTEHDQNWRYAGFRLGIDLK